MRALAALLSLFGAGLVTASFFLPVDFAWNGLATFRFCVSTAHYAETGCARFIWWAFAAGALYPYLWALTASLAVLLNLRGESVKASLGPAATTTAGNLLLVTVGVLLIATREAWPAPVAQWAMAGGALAHLAAVWWTYRLCRPHHRMAAVVVAGGLPFLALTIVLGGVSYRYGSEISGFVLAALGLLAVMSGAVVHR